MEEREQGNRKEKRDKTGLKPKREGKEKQRTSVIAKGERERKEERQRVCRVSPSVLCWAVLYFHFQMPG
jgi:hypothetical protein